MSVSLAKKYFNVDEYYRMAEVGILAFGERMELIEGEIYPMSPIGNYHASCVAQLAETLNSLKINNWFMWVQNPIRLDEYNEPEPDIALLKRRDDFYRNHHPRPQEVLLVIEVADTSLDHDRKVKVPLYARAGIPEVWVIALNMGWIEVYAEPSNGEYTLIRRWKVGEILVSPTIADLSIEVGLFFQ
jgi:Uma2 family endonuclease